MVAMLAVLHLTLVVGTIAVTCPEHPRVWDDKFLYSADVVETECATGQFCARMITVGSRSTGLAQKCTDNPHQTSEGLRVTYEASVGSCCRESYNSLTSRDRVILFDTNPGLFANATARKAYTDQYNALDYTECPCMCKKDPSSSARRRQWWGDSGRRRRSGIRSDEEAAAVAAQATCPFAADHEDTQATTPNGASTKVEEAMGSSTTTQVAPSAKVEHIFDALIDLDDPTTFTVEKFVDAVKSATGVSEVPTAVVKAFEVIVQYTVPHAAMVAQIKNVVAATNSVQEDQVAVIQSTGRHLKTQEGSTITLAPKDIDVTITIDGTTDPAAAALQAKEVKASAGTATAAALGTTLRGNVTVKTEPKAKAKVETKLQAEASKASQMKTAISSDTVGTAVGGTVTVSTTPSESPIQATPLPTDYAASSFSAVFTLFVVIIQAAMTL